MLTAGPQLLFVKFWETVLEYSCIHLIVNRIHKYHVKYFIRLTKEVWLFVYRKYSQYSLSLSVG